MTNPGPGIVQTTNVTANLATPSLTALQLSGALTVAQLPTVGIAYGASAYTSDQGAVRWNGAAWVPGVAYAAQSILAQQRQTYINNFLIGALQNAPAWAATTAYVVNNCVTIPNGQVLCCQTAGTSGSTAPAYSPTNPAGRPITDGTVVWGSAVIRNAPAGEIPTEVLPASVTLYASAAAAGLTETIICTGTGNTTLNSNVSLYGGLPAPGTGYQSSLAAFTFAAGLAAGGGNATGAATAQGYSALYGYQTYHYDVEFYCTDAVVALTFTNNSNQPISIEIDGYTVQANPQLTGSTAGQCLVVDYGGLVKRRKVRWNAPGTALTLRGFALSTSGYVEPSDTSTTDNMLWIGDSIGGSVASDFPASANVVCIGAILKRLLGMNVITVSISGSGYTVANPNEFTVQGVLTNSENQKIFPKFNPSHILHTSGFNDRGQNTPQVIAAAALLAWQTTRSQYPAAKITVTDGFSQAAGPDANGIAVAAALLAEFNAWGDTNSRFIQSIGSSTVVGSGNTTAWVRGTAISTGAIGAGNSCWVVGSGGTHSTGEGALYQANRMAQAIISAWNGAY